MCSYSGKATSAQDRQKSCGGRRQTTAAGTAQEAGNHLCLGRRVAGLGRNAFFSLPVPQFRFNVTDRLETPCDSLGRCTQVALSYNNAVVNSQ